MVDSVNAERFTVDQMASKFKKHSNINEWKSDSLWDFSSDLRLLLTSYLPDSSLDGCIYGHISYTSAMALGLLLCSGSIHDKAKYLFDLMESYS